MDTDAVPSRFAACGRGANVYDRVQMQSADAAKTRAGGLHGIGYYLIALIVLAVAPPLVIAGIVVVWQTGVQREEYQRSLLQTSLALTIAVDGHLDSYRTTLETLSRSGELLQGRLAEFKATAARVADASGAAFITLFDADGRTVFTTREGDPGPAGAPAPLPPPDMRTEPPEGDDGSLAAVLHSGRYAISDLFRDDHGQQLLFAVNVPVIQQGRLSYVLRAAFPPVTMTRLLEQNTRFSGVPAVVFDRGGFIVGRWRDAEKFVGRRISAFGTIRGTDSGVGTGTTLEGIPVVYSYARSAVSGWGVNVGSEQTRVDAAIKRNWAVGTTLAGAGLLFGIITALALASRLRKSIVHLAEFAAGVDPPRKDGLRTREIARLEQTLIDAAEARRAQAMDRESRLVAEAREAEADAASRLKDRFIAVLSHELRNPLAPIRNAVVLLRLLQERGDCAAMKEIIEVLSRQSDQLARLVNDLLDISRLRMGKLTLQCSRIDLRSVGDHAAESVLPAISARQQRLERLSSARPVEVNADFARLSQVTTNLLDNAGKFSPSGGRIVLSVQAIGDTAVLSVQDNGAGIAADELPRIFSDIERSSVKQTAHSGLGLGLPLSKQLVELHGGTLEIRSEGSGKGCLCIVRLPLAGAAAAPAQTPSAGDAGSQALASRRARVLVVDDNVDAAQTLSLLLRSLGHDARAVHDGRSALEVIAEFRPEVVFLDIGMPGMDGYEVAAELRRRPALRRLLIVAVTGWGQERDKARSRQAGFDLHLVKPITAEDITRVLNGE